MKYVTIKLTKTGSSLGPFILKDPSGKVLRDDIPLDLLILGIDVPVSKDLLFVVLSSKDDCSFEKTVPILSHDPSKLNVKLDRDKVSCIFEHYKDPSLFNNFYGWIHPYIIEYPFAYQYHDQILQNVQDYTKSHKILVSGNDIQRVEVDAYFNKAVIYNGQQSTGLLEIVSKPKNNLRLYMDYPLYTPTSKVITYAKNDNFYQYNTFWSIVKDPMVSLFKKSCKSLSIDKEINNDNMDYSRKSYQKYSIRAKEVKIRSILDNRSDVLLVSQFVVTGSQVSHK